MGLMQMVGLGSGGSSVSIVLSGVNLSDIKSGAPSTCSITLKPDGTTSYVGSDSIGSANWSSPAPPPYTLYVMATVVTGSAPTGALTGSPISLDANRTWTWTTTLGTSKSGRLRLDFYADSLGAVFLGSHTFDASADSDV